MQTSDQQVRRAMIVTGEASGDLHGAHLIEAAGKIDSGLSFFGVGGTKMAAAGCDILIPGETLSVMGIVEVLGHFPTIYRAFQYLKKILHGSDKPQLLILIDFPEFNLRLAKEANRAGVPVLYYVSPQVWAWRQGRVKKIAAVVDHLAAIFPFEPDFYKGQDMDVTYVGNPLAEEAQVTVERDAFLGKLELDSHKPVVGLFPGSRQSELKYNFATIRATAERLQEERPEIQFLMPVASSFSPEMLQERLSGSAARVTLVQESIYDVANACDAVLTVSGTVTLQTALIGTPMAILYKLAPISFEIGKRMVKVPHIGLANIVAGEGAVREFVQGQATAEALSEELLRLIDDQEYASIVRTKLARVRERIGPPGCSERVARIASRLSRGLKGEG